MQQKVQDQLATIQVQLKDIQGLLSAQSQAAVQKSKDLVAQLTPKQKKVALALVAKVCCVAVFRAGMSVRHYLAQRRRLAEVEQQKEDGKVHLYIRPRSPWAPSLSTYSSKLETFLRLANIEYEAIPTMNTFPSPNECLPFIVYKGQVLGDSKRIIEFLTTEFHVTMDHKLNRLERATGTALVEMVDMSMTPSFNRLNIVDYPQVATAMISKAFHVPTFVARVGASQFGRSLRARRKLSPLYALTLEQYELEFIRDYEAIEQQIGEKPFLFGDEPTSYDCAVYSVLIPFVNMKQYAEVSEAYLAVARSPILVEYLQRLTERAFPDFEELVNATEAACSELAESMVGDELHAEEHEDAVVEEVPAASA